MSDSAAATVSLRRACCDVETDAASGAACRAGALAPSWQHALGLSRDHNRGSTPAFVVNRLCKQLPRNLHVQRTLERLAESLRHRGMCCGVSPGLQSEACDEVHGSQGFSTHPRGACRAPVPRRRRSPRTARDAPSPSPGPAPVVAGRRVRVRPHHLHREYFLKRSVRKSRVTPRHLHHIPRLCLAEGGLSSQTTTSTTSTAQGQSEDSAWCPTTFTWCPVCEPHTSLVECQPRLVYAQPRTPPREWRARHRGLKAHARF